jgi:hypothetical protein
MNEDGIDKTRRRCGIDEKYIQGFSWKIRRKEKLGRPMHRWDDNIKMYFKNSTKMRGMNSFS